MNVPLPTDREMHLMVKREGIDKTWNVAPYKIKSQADAERIVAFLKSAWSIPFEWKVTS